MSTSKRLKSESPYEKEDGVELLSNLFQCCKEISKDLPAPYDASVYYAALDDVLMPVLSKNGGYYRRNVLLCITSPKSPKVLSSIKVPLVIFNHRSDPVIVVELKTKKTQLKSLDMDFLRCAIDQMKKTGNVKPVGCLVRICNGETEGLILQKDDTLEEII